MWDELYKHKVVVVVLHFMHIPHKCMVSHVLWVSVFVDNVVVVSAFWRIVWNVRVSRMAHEPCLLFLSSARRKRK